MGVDLLDIVRAEQEADTMLKEAQDRKAQLLQQALVDRQVRLANIHAPEVRTPELKPVKVNLSTLTDAAKRNRQKAIKVILEAFNEA